MAKLRESREPKHAHVHVVFTEDELALWRYIVQQAKANSRTLAGQARYMLKVAAAQMGNGDAS